MLPCWHVPAWSINLPIGWAWCGGLLFIIIYFWVSFALPTSKTLEKIPHNDVLGQIHPLIGTFTQMNLVFNSKWWQQVFQNEFQPFRSQMNFSTGRTIDLNLTIYVKGSPPPPFFNDFREWTLFEPYWTIFGHFWVKIRALVRLHFQSWTWFDLLIIWGVKFWWITFFKDW